MKIIIFAVFVIIWGWFIFSYIPHSHVEYWLVTARFQIKRGEVIQKDVQQTFNVKCRTLSDWFGSVQTNGCGASITILGAWKTTSKDFDESLKRGGYQTIDQIIGCSK